MTKKEAIQAMLDGKKVKKRGWVLQYVYFNGNKFVYESGASVEINYFDSEEWKIYDEKLTPVQALKEIEKLLGGQLFEYDIQNILNKTDYK